MQAYKVLRDAGARAAYDACLAERRRQSRRRLAHCAGLMMTSFVLTAASAIFVMSMAGANVPFRETWQLAVKAVAPSKAKAPAVQSDGQEDGAGWTTQVAVAAASESPVPPPDRVLAAPPAAKAAPKPVTAKGRQGAPDSPDSRAKDMRQQVATASKQAPSAAKRWEPPSSSTSDESWPSFPRSDEQPRYSLGASDLR
jgi:hypothetical protein